MNDPAAQADAAKVTTTVKETAAATAALLRIEKATDTGTRLRRDDGIRGEAEGLNSQVELWVFMKFEILTRWRRRTPETGNV